MSRCLGRFFLNKNVLSVPWVPCSTRTSGKVGMTMFGVWSAAAAFSVRTARSPVTGGDSSRGLQELEAWELEELELEAHLVTARVWATIGLSFLKSLLLSSILCTFLALQRIADD